MNPNRLPEETVRLGPFAVRTDANDVREFAAALRIGGEQPEQNIPFTFPIRWLALPEIRAAVMGALSLPQGLVVQESQAFDYAQALAHDREYRLALEVRVARGDPVRIFIHGGIEDLGGNQILTLDTVLRIVTSLDLRERSS